MTRSPVSLWQVACDPPTESRWAKNGVLARVVEHLEAQMDVPPEAFSIDSTMVKVHSDGTGALKNGPQSMGKSRGGWTTKIPRLLQVIAKQ